MGVLKGTIGTVPLESVLCTELLEQRPSRPPDYQAEIQAVLALVQELKNAPSSVLQRLVDTALELCRGHSAGISLLEEGAPGHLSPRGDHFRWHAVAGQWAPLIWETTTRRDYGPCGTVLDRDRTLLFTNAHRHYSQFAGVQPLLIEGLLAPFHVGGQAVGTVWVVAHDDSRKFDAEDRRLLESLAEFAATAYQVLATLSALLEADRRKNEFLAMLAHELRNPLAPIRNALQAMRLTGGNGETAQSPLAMMERQVSHMARLVDDLLDVSRINRGKIELRKERVELASAVNHAVEAARPHCEGMGQELTVALPLQPVYLNADPTRVAQVVGNLLNNACKFTQRDGHILLTVEGASGGGNSPGEAVIRVRDDGVGIAADQLPRIFDMFMQVDTSLERSGGGLGMGLTLVKDLVEMHGGTVEAHSAGVGQGSEFVVRLPIAVEAPKPPPEPSIRPPRATTRRILIVDDNRDAAESLAILLKLRGNETLTAYDGLEAVEAAATFHPDVVLLDIGLPKLNGYETARRIREQPWGNGIVLVALTGWGKDEDRQKSREAGFNRHLLKPVDGAALMKLLDEWQP